MNSDNKTNLKRLLCLFTVLLVIFLSVVTVSVSLKFWWASIPVSVSAFTGAALLFWVGVVKPDLKNKDKP